MGEPRFRPSVRRGAALTVLTLMLNSIGIAQASATPDDELAWEEGTVTAISDGDTLVAEMDTGPGARGSQRVRTIGVQAPETSPQDCGASQAKDRLAGQLPVGSRVQTRSVDVRSNDDYSGGRIVRSLYAQDEEGNWYDTSRGSVSDGWLMWFPLAADSSNKPEWAHNLEYRVLADDASGQRRGLWSADLCGASPASGADLRVWAKYWGTEQVFVENRSGFDVDLSGWTIRDSALSAYRTLPAGTVVPAGQVRMVFSGDLNLNNLPSSNRAFEGDAVYLMDNSGPYRTGNLRAWFPYPCNPDDCTDPLAGNLSLELAQVSDPGYRAPSAPGTVTVSVTADGSGTASLTWVGPNDLGGPTVTYSVTSTAIDGGAEPSPISGISGLSQVVTGLTPGRSYTFSVAATNNVGTSTAATTSTVTISELGGANATAGPSSAPPDATPWVTGEVVLLKNTSSQTQRLGGYGIWDRYSAAETSTDYARYVFAAEQTIAAGATLRVHFGTTPTPAPAAPTGQTWLWTSTPAFIDDAATGGDYVELANLNRAQVACATTPGGSCRGSQVLSVSTAPVGITARSTTGNVTVSWGAPISRGGTAITGYRATAFDAPIGGTALGSCTTDGAGRSCSVPASVGQRLHVEVTATNSQGTSGPSWRVLAAPRTVPTAPPSVSVTSTPGGLNVSWSPASENGATITGYTAAILSAATGGRSVGSCATSSAAVTGCTVLGLQGGNTYFVAVSATNRAGAGPANSPRAVGKPGPGSAISTYAKRRVTVRWDPPGTNSGVSGYQATLYSKASGGKKLGECSATQTATSCRTGKLRKRGAFYIDLTMKSAGGNYVNKPRFTAGAPRRAAAPKVTSAVSVNRSVVVGVQAPSFIGYSALGAYSVRLYTRSRGGSQRGSCTTAASTPSCSTKSMKKGSYWSAARVSNGVGWSKWSKRVKVVVR